MCSNATRRLVEREPVIIPRHDALHDKQLEQLEKDANVTYEAEGVNFYLRLGAMGKQMFLSSLILG
jgi:hypothetical protein